MHPTLLSEVLPDLTRWITVTVNVPSPVNWISFLSSGVALLVAAGGIVFQIWHTNGQNARHEREAKEQNERQERREVEAFIRQKVEEYFLRSEQVFMAFSRWIDQIGKGDTANREPLHEYLGAEGYLTMLETLYFPSLHKTDRAVGEIAHGIASAFHKLAGLSREAKGSGLSADMDVFEGEWRKQREEFFAKIDTVNKLLSSLDVAKLAQDYMEKTNPQPWR
jgi:hypothetical protein